MGKKMVVGLKVNGKIYRLFVKDIRKVYERDTKSRPPVPSYRHSELDIKSKLMNDSQELSEETKIGGEF